MVDLKYLEKSLYWVYKPFFCYYLSTALQCKNCIYYVYAYMLDISSNEKMGIYCTVKMLYYFIEIFGNVYILVSERDFGTSPHNNKTGLCTNQSLDKSTANKEQS